VYIFHKGKVAAWGSPVELIKRYAPKARIVVQGRRLSNPPSVEGATLVRYSDDTVIYATMDPGEALPRIVEALVKANAFIERVEVRKPGLAEVYMAVTSSVAAGRR